MRDEAVYLVSLVDSGNKDEYGNAIMEEKKELVFASIKSIGQTEFYQAQTSDQKPEIKFVITDYQDYSNQLFLIHNEIRYKIQRTYRNKNNELEITCYGGVRDAVATVSD
jgi:SPP1 family predicted phage head-tail adaptor